MNNFINHLISYFKTKNSNLHIFAHLPQELKDKICILSGHFKLRYDNKAKKYILVSQLNLNSEKWKKFEELFSHCIKQKTKIVYVYVAYSAYTGLGGISYTY